MKALSSVLLALSLLLPSALQAQEEPTSSPYYPLKVGSTWHYRAGENKFLLRVARHEMVAGVMTARVELVVDGKVQSFEHIGASKEGLFRYSFDSKELKPPVRFLQIPPSKGASWKVDSKYNNETLTGTFTLGEAEATVPAGTYKTVTSTGKDLDANGTKVDVTYFFAENLGMVKQIIEIAGQKVVIELEKFDKAMP